LRWSRPCPDLLSRCAGRGIGGSHQHTGQDGAWQVVMRGAGGWTGTTDLARASCSSSFRIVLVPTNTVINRTTSGSSVSAGSTGERT
jgi:hypothetical protein